MTGHKMLGPNIEMLFRRKVQESASLIVTPDIWSGISGRLRTQPQHRIWRPELPLRPRWLAPASMVTFAVIAVMVWVVLLNNQDSAGNPAEQGALEGELSGLPEESGTPVDTGVIDEALVRLETAGPFRIEAELFTSGRRGGRMESLPAALNNPVTKDGRTLLDLHNSGDRTFDYFNELVEQDCVEDGSDRVCLLAVYEDSIPVARSTVIGGTYRFESVLATPDLYRVERTMTVSPGFKRQLDEWDAELDISFAEESVTIRQQTGRYFDSASPTTGGYGLINEGSANTFVALHLDPGYTGDPVSIDDIVTFSNVRQVGEASPDGTVHYRADISGQIGETGTWEMWVGADGLPRRIEIEAFNPRRWANYRSDEVEVTRASIDFLDYGESLDPEDPLSRLLSPKSQYEKRDERYLVIGPDGRLLFEDSTGLRYLCVWAEYSVSPETCIKYAPASRLTQQLDG